MEPKIRDGIVFPMNHPNSAVIRAAPVIRPNHLSTYVPQNAPRKLASSTPKTTQIIQSRPVRRRGSALNHRKAAAARNDWRKFAGRYAAETGMGAEPLNALEMNG